MGMNLGRWEGILRSPIEKQLGAAFIELEGDEEWHAIIDYDNPALMVGCGPTGAGCYVVPQIRVGRYTIDFGFIRVQKYGCLALAVELDGHEFHEKTKEQVKRFRMRDRELLRAGWPTIRFTGSEVFGDALSCAQEAFDTMGVMCDADDERSQADFSCGINYGELRAAKRYDKVQ